MLFASISGRKGKIPPRGIRPANQTDVWGDDRAGNAHASRWAQLYFTAPATKSSTMTPNSEATFLRDEILAAIKRAAQESDITLCQAIGVLRMCEHTLLRMIDGEIEKRDAGEATLD